MGAVSNISVEKLLLFPKRIGLLENKKLEGRTSTSIIIDVQNSMKLEKFANKIFLIKSY